MKLKCLSLDPVLIDNQLQTLNLAGLEAIEIFMFTEPVPISWLSRFASTHPTLNELWFFEIYQTLFTDNAPPFLSSLVDNFRQELHDTSTLSNIGLRRPIGRSSQEWHVIGLTLRTRHSLIEKLLLSASSFPKLEILTLDLESQQGMFDIEDLSSVLARFSSLRELRVRVERELWALTSYMAKKVRSLDSIYIEDAGYGYEDEYTIQLWGFKGSSCTQ
ncbi:hypothetical protein F5880DRAFT_1555444 [Lentinula raphanica]|nr:hypothetical protein F5880DRAFT_1555444 [Lentinula raphanica]